MKINNNNNNNSKSIKKDILYTYPIISSGIIKEISINSIQYNILQLIFDKIGVKPMGEKIGRTKSTIQYHINKLHFLQLVYKTSTNNDPKKFGVWRLTNSGKQILNGAKRKVVSIKKKVVNKSCQLTKRIPNTNNLTEKERLIYSMVVDEGKTHDMIRIELNCSKQNVSKLYNKAKNKVEIKGQSINEVVNKVSSHPICPKPLRYRSHNWRWSIRILKKLDNFVGVCNDEVDNCTIKIWEESIEIYSSLDFFANDKETAFINGLKYWVSFWEKLERLYGVILTIKGVMNKQLIKCELAQTNNEMATTCIKEGNKIIFRDKNGVAWATIDNSFNFFEFEVIRADSLNPDMACVQKHLNDWRDNPNTLTNSKITEKINLLENLNSNNADGISTLLQIAPAMAEYNKNLKLHIKVQQEQLETQLATQKLLEKLGDKL